MDLSRDLKYAGITHPDKDIVEEAIKSQKLNRELLTVAFKRVYSRSAGQVRGGWLEKILVSQKEKGVMPIVIEYALNEAESEMRRRSAPATTRGHEIAPRKNWKITGTHVRN